MYFIKLAVSFVFVIALLSACGTDKATQELKANDTNKAVAKVENTATQAPTPTAAAKKEDIWTYYNEAKWSDDFKGLKSEIQKVVVSDRAPNKDDQNTFDGSLVGIKFKLENTTDGIFTTYPDQARLVTSTGEQIDNAEMFLSDDLGGEIEKGVIKEGNIMWYLQRGHAADITWIKLKWTATVGTDFGGERKEYNIELKLK